MAEKLLNIVTVTEYNDMLGVETLHPLVSESTCQKQNRCTI